MKICIPVNDVRGLDGEPYGHFGSAERFMLVDSDSMETQIVDNGDHGHAHGTCQPLRGLAGQKLDAIIVGGIGARAVERLNEAGIRVYRSTAGTVRDNVEALKKGALEELNADNSCGHHGHGHGCGA
jgi:predicted Fe-Mo cluster-binding NifX family protein